MKQVKLARKKKKKKVFRQRLRGEILTKPSWYTWYLAPDPF